MRSRLKVFILFTVLGMLVTPLKAQCVMCTATAEQSGSDFNTGILYLMAVPYILVAVVGFVWYRNSKRNKIDE